MANFFVTPPATPAPSNGRRSSNVDEITAGDFVIGTLPVPRPLRDTHASRALPICLVPSEGRVRQLCADDFDRFAAWLEENSVQSLLLSQPST